MCVEAFTDYPPLGRFAVRYVLFFNHSSQHLTDLYHSDMRQTVAVGVVSLPFTFLSLRLQC
jgi:hypothetical protein